MEPTRRQNDPSGADLRIDIQDPGELREWTRKLDATPEEIREAVAAVGDRAADVELHLKGTRASTNSERVAGSD